MNDLFNKVKSQIKDAEKDLQTLEDWLRPEGLKDSDIEEFHNIKNRLIKTLGDVDELHKIMIFRTRKVGKIDLSNIEDEEK